MRNLLAQARLKISTIEKELVLANRRVQEALNVASTATWGAITGTISSQSDLSNALNGKAPASHGHAIASIAGLQTVIDGKQPAGSYASASHGHAIGDTAGLQAALDGKSGTGHSHSGLAPSGGAAGQVLKKSTNTDFDYAWANDALGQGGSAAISAVIVDFGSTPSTGKFFDVALQGATIGQKIMASVSLDMPSGVAEDELEMDPIVCHGHVKTTDQVRLFVGSLNRGILSGQRRINVMAA